MREFISSRTRLWAVGGLWAGLLLSAFDLYAAVVTYIPQYGVRNDFRLIYGAAETGLHQGYAHLYDLAAQRASVEGLGPGFYWSPFLNPPPLAWLATPFTLLAFTPAIILWTALLVGAGLFVWAVVATGSPLVRAAHLALWFGLFPVAFGLMVGQPVVLVAAAVAASWWLMERGRSVPAGLVLALILIKPQLALLVPLCLLVSGRWKVFAAFLAASLAMGAVALAMLGPDGVQRYRDVLSLAAGWDITRRYAVAGPLGIGPQIYAVQVVVLALALLASWRHRGGRAGIPVAAGIVASLLFTPYVGFQDFAMLVVAGWLTVREGPSAPQVALLVVGYALLELALLVLAVPILIAEAGLLLSFLSAPRRGPVAPDTPAG
ncbi:MAG: glycosyltransferase family 87 protein [Candidatus Dormibacterales bacterium]